MKFSLAIALAASLLLTGCSVFQRSPTWDLVVRSRGSGAIEDGGKSSYVNRLHEALAAAGVEHKVVAYQFRLQNVYHEDAVQAGVAVVYRDDTTPNNPWWVIDEYHHTPVWVPNWGLQDQLSFFIQNRAEVLSVKEFAGGAPSARQVVRRSAREEKELAETRPGRAYRSLFAAGKTPRLTIPRQQKTVAVPASADPMEATSLSAEDSRAAAAFRQRHGTDFDPRSSIDRQKMSELRRRLLARNTVAKLRLR